MDRKRKENPNGRNLVNGKNKKQKVDLSKETFLSDINALALYTSEDRYYRGVKTDIGALELRWT